MTSPEAGVPTPTPGNPTPNPPGLDAGDAGATGIIVSVISGGKPVANARVLFHDEAGAVTGDFATDAAGSVTQATVPSQVTVVPPAAADGEVDLITYTAVKAGDHLLVDTTPAFTESGALQQFSATLPSDDTAVSYLARLDRSCGGGTETTGSPAIFVVDSSCLRLKNAVVGIAFDELGIPTKYAAKKGLAAPTGTVAVTLDAWVDPTLLTTTYANLPADITNLFARSVAVIDQNSINVPESIGDSIDTAMHFVEPPGSIATAYQNALVETAFDQTNFGSRAIMKRQPTNQPTMALDYAKNLPKFTSGTLDSADVARPSLTWTTERALAGADVADVIAARFGWSNTTPTFARRTWTFVVPVTATTVKAPQLPADAATLVPNADSDPFVDGILAIDSDAITTYEEAKKLPFPVAFGKPSDIGYPMPADGTLRLSAYGYALDTFLGD